MTNVIAVLHFDEQHAKPGIVMPPLPTISTEAIQLLKELGWTPPAAQEVFDRISAEAKPCTAVVYDPHAPVAMFWRCTKLANCDGNHEWPDVLAEIQAQRGGVRHICPTCGTSWDADIAACPECQDAAAPDLPGDIGPND